MKKWVVEEIRYIMQNLSTSMSRFLCPAQYHRNKSPPLCWCLHPGRVISHCWQGLLVTIASVEIQSEQTGWERNQFLCTKKCLLPGMSDLEVGTAACCPTLSVQHSHFLDNTHCFNEYHVPLCIDFLWCAPALLPDTPEALRWSCNHH